MINYSLLVTDLLISVDKLMQLDNFKHTCLKTCIIPRDSRVIIAKAVKTKS